jgi:hypothetical protein
MVEEPRPCRENNLSKNRLRDAARDKLGHVSIPFRRQMDAVLHEIALIGGGNAANMAAAS